MDVIGIRGASKSHNVKRKKQTGKSGFSKMIGKMDPSENTNPIPSQRNIPIFFDDQQQSEKKKFASSMKNALRDLQKIILRMLEQNPALAEINSLKSRLKNLEKDVIDMGSRDIYDSLMLRLEVEIAKLENTH